MKTITPRIPRMSNASTLLANAAAITPHKRQNWALQKRLPSQIRHDRQIAEIKERVQNVIDTAKAKFKGKPSIFLAIKNAGRHGFRILGFGNEDGTPRYARNLAECRSFARSVGRKMLKCGEREYTVGIAD